VSPATGAGIGAQSVIEAVGTRKSMRQALHAVRPGGNIGYVGVTHGDLPGGQLFFSHAHPHGRLAPVLRFLPALIDLIGNRDIEPGKVFDLRLPLDRVAEGYRAMDERRAIRTLLCHDKRYWLGAAQGGPLTSMAASDEGGTAKRSLREVQSL
jgi:threonine dehydrogenase-like Zn-dependent dehydrogenase